MSDSRQSRSRVLAIAIGACSVLTAASVLLVLATSNTTERVAVNARHLHWTNSALGSASIARAANAQAVFFAVDRAAGFASQAALDDAVEEAKSALDNVEAIRSAPIAESRPIDNSLDSLLLSGRRVLSFVEGGDAEAALEANGGEFEASYREVEGELSGQIEVIRADIASSEGSAGRIASITQVFVTLLIPLAAFALYRYLVRRQLQERRIEFEAKLEAERELSRSKDEFIAGLSHEFRTPLTAIFGFSELLIEQGFIDPDMSFELIGLINTESAELSRMVEDLLMAARIEAGELTIERCSVEIGDEIAAVLAPFTRGGWSVEMQAAPGQAWIDALRLRQVLRNLVSNAVKHGGPNIGVFGRAAAGSYLVSVVDDGAGVSPEIADRLFERFVHDGRGALLAGSVGLGLNIARSLTEAMGGRLTYERVGSSTVFTVSLPQAGASGARAEAPVAQEVP